MNKNIDDISIEPVQIKRYGQALFNVDKSNLIPELQKLQIQFPGFLGKDLLDTFNLMKVRNFISDPQLIEVAKSCNQIYPDLNFLEKELTDAFKYMKYYFPEFEPIGVYSYISGFDYEFPISYDGRIMMIALDMYLGSAYSTYKEIGVPKYKMQNYSSDYISRDCIGQIAYTLIGNNKHKKNMLDLMVKQGKQLYFLDAILPNLADSIKIKYTKRQMKWVDDHEARLWAFLIENELLYSSDRNVEKKLLLDAPFTSYFGNDSPPRLGEWIGWKIVRQYMKTNPDTGMEELLKNNDSQGILQKSGYKPKM